MTPNAVSVAGVLVAIAAASAYAALAWPVNAVAGFGLHILWHVVDGADGDLARRTGRASLSGEIVDGICDHASQLMLYGVFGAMAAAQFGVIAWPFAVFAALSHFFQANSYETARRKYRRRVYGATSLREDLKPAAKPGLAGRLGLFYVAMSKQVTVDDEDVEASMARLLQDPKTADRARALYRKFHQPIVKRRALLSSNHRTVAGFVSVLAGSPFYFFLYEMTVLNVAMALFNARQKKRNAQLLTELSPLG
jgi:phosphatidylglycerophosphate synthase